MAPAGKPSANRLTWKLQEFSAPNQRVRTLSSRVLNSLARRKFPVNLYYPLPAAPRKMQGMDAPSSPPRPDTETPDADPALPAARPRYRFRLRRFLKWLPVYLILSFALYVLSAGPLYWTLFSAYYLDTAPLLKVLYLPLVLLCTIFPAFGAWVDWYVGLWVL